MTLYAAPSLAQRRRNASKKCGPGLYPTAANPQHVFERPCGVKESNFDTVRCARASNSRLLGAWPSGWFPAAHRMFETD